MLPFLLTVCNWLTDETDQSQEQDAMLCKILGRSRLASVSLHSNSRSKGPFKILNNADQTVDFRVCENANFHRIPTPPSDSNSIDHQQGLKKTLKFKNHYSAERWGEMQNVHVIIGMGQSLF